LVQLPAAERPEAIFGDYAYFSSYSESWLAHCRRFAGAAIERFDLGPDTLVVEVASNDGYLLQYFRDAGVPVLGIEPAANVARVAEENGIPTRVRFFGRELAAELAAAGERADLLVGNNVLAHVPDLNDFLAGVEIALAPGGGASFALPHLLRLPRPLSGRALDKDFYATIKTIISARLAGMRSIRPGCAACSSDRIRRRRRRRPAGSAARRRPRERR
jgi:SAM-dependent methyltransferase